MKRFTPLCAAMLAAMSAVADAPTFTLGTPTLPGTICDTDNTESNLWLCANDVVVPSSGWQTEKAETIVDPQVPSGEAYSLATAEIGFSWERLKPEYYRADRIRPPDGVDWAATYAAYEERRARGEKMGFVFNPSKDDPCVYVVDGGIQTFEWVLTDRSVKRESYVVGVTCSGRPRRIFWTDAPYNGPTVSLVGKFVKLYGNDELLTLHYGSKTNVSGGVKTVQDGVVVSGLYVDETSYTLFAAGRLSGQCVMVYYDTGEYKNVLHVQVIEVSRPVANALKGTIGAALKPDGGGYSVEGLVPYVTEGDGAASDDRGNYLYRHKGNYSYSPKNGNVYPLRPTVGERWKAEIYWKEIDPMDVLWPFELDQYECDWPSSGCLYVRGDVNGDCGAKIYVPSDYSVDLMSYQEPDGHARKDDSSAFYTTGAGWSLLKLTADDNIWFMPVHSVLRSDSAYFTLKPSRILVGQEFAIRGGSRSGIAEGQTETISATGDVPGYVYKAVSGTQYDVNLYRETTNATSAVASQVVSSDSSATNVPSAIFAINTGDKDVEVWWSRRYQADDMPSAIDVPVLPQVYRPIWPNETQAPTIVIASQQGSANRGICPHHGAAYFDSTNAVLRLADKRYFSSRGGTVSFWMKYALFDVGQDGNEEETNGRYTHPFLHLFTENSHFHLQHKPMYNNPGEWENAYRFLWNDECLVDCPTGPANPDDGVSAPWEHFAFTFDAEGRATIYGNGAVIGTGTLPNAALSELSGLLTDCAVGKSPRAPVNAQVGRIVAELTFWDRCLAAEEITNAMYFASTDCPTDVTGYYSFRSGEDLESENQQAAGAIDERHFHERVSDAVCTAQDVALVTPGAPALLPCVVDSDVTPTVYVQNDASAPGYNPNEEHAFVRAGEGGYVAWALRGDLNVASSSRPGVFVEYEKDGRAKMQFFHVAVTNAFWPTLSDVCTAGTQLPGPHPIDMMDDPWLAEDYWDADSEYANRSGPAYRDRKGQIWARAAGALPIHLYYRMQEGFWFPQYSADSQPAVGAALPWLSAFGAGANADDPAGASARPAAWTWTVNWPANPLVMDIGQTLYAAADGLPGVYDMKSLAVLYPTAEQDAADGATVTLSDPTAMRSVSFKYDALKSLGLSTDPNGGLTLRGGKAYFTELPPHLSSRVYLDTTNDKLCFVGKYDKKNAGVSVLYPNVLSSEDRERLLNLVAQDKRSTSEFRLFAQAVENLAPEPTLPTDVRDVGGELKSAYQARDSYALTAMGMTNWVVLIENDAPTTNETRVAGTATNVVNLGVNDGDAIQMHVFFVTNRYHAGRIVAREDENNLLSQQLSVVYDSAFGGDADDYVFEWRSATPNSDGTIPESYDDPQVYQSRSHYGSVRTNMLAGATRIVVGEQGDTLANMVNKYWICRYRAKDETSPAWKTMGDAWSAWCAPPALAEGWVQRVLNNVTPFNQLMTDLYENETETTVSMIEKAGRPYVGDVALNQDALTSCGLVELYETIFNKAESMSLMREVSDENVDKQLMLCAERLDDLYTLLGDEAYSDAKNPTIGFGSETVLPSGAGITVDYGAASSSLFCFDNQVSSLLDEELALLRGRTAESAPYVTKTTAGGTYKVMGTAPYYNRLLWNFTKGITAGEVAYAVNYNVEGTETTALSEEQAAVLYPQGHGDAYGHYLSALKGWYRLLRNPYFSWACAQGETSLADATVNVDYQEEAKFATAALNVAKTAADVVDLTAREAWGDTGAEASGFRDSDERRAFGYGEWANRGAYGALVNWAVANSLLPADASAQGEAADYDDDGLARIDRGTVGELSTLAGKIDEIQSAEDRVDGGRNPLGLSDDAIPFDITPIGASDGTKTHYEQIRERAGVALDNARKVLDRAQEYGNRLRMLQEATDALEDSVEQEEHALTQELIGYFGKPYADDVGPSGTYEQGYEGPDLYHYMWMDISKYGLDSIEDTASVKAYYFTDLAHWSWKYAVGNLLSNFANPSSLRGFWYMSKDYNNLKSEHKLAYEVSGSGLVVKPSYITGTRPAQGTIQEKYGEFLSAYSLMKLAQNDYQVAANNFNNSSSRIKTSTAISFGILSIQTAVNGYFYHLDQKCIWYQKALNALEYYSSLTEDQQSALSSMAPTVVGVGMTTVTSPQSFVMAAWKSATKLQGSNAAYQTMRYKNSLAEDSFMTGTYLGDIVSAAGTYYSEVQDLLKDLEEKALVVNEKYTAMQSAYNTLIASIDAYNSEVAKGEQVLERRKLLRQQWVNQFSQARYNDMFFRQLRNQALSRYTASFDLAQKYAYEAAKAYDYETALLSSDEAAGRNFLRQIVASRSLGSFADDGSPMVGDVGDTGLAGLLAQMDANWLVLKPRLGINNPQPYATWFSLRRECFRILPGADGDKAWAKELTKHWVDDVRSDANFVRHCQPFQSQFGLKEQEPGLVFTFETTIDFAKNLFGNDLAGGDSAYDSTWYATRIAAAGIWFDGYNSMADGYDGNVGLSSTPVAYLVPIGSDCMRVPGMDDGEVMSFNVVDQVIAAPYAIGSQHLNDLSWYPTASQGDLGGADETTKIRRHPSFRAYYDANGGKPTDAQLDCARLVGRSVWNTKWMLVIPAGSMGADRDKALSVFINGSDENRDGKSDLLPVSDIRIGFKTYSNSGN